MPRQFFVTISLLTSVIIPHCAHAAELPRFVSPQSCSTSLCHGGAGELHEQHSIWSRQDMHSRSYTTLTTARSEQIMRALGAANAPTDTRCTTCHAPYHGVNAKRFATPIKAAVGVSCQNCHGAAGKWIRAHTRTDYSHADRIQAGMRELRSLHPRANACVACHQNVSEDLLTAGHPELIFELDGQTLAIPRHWVERGFHRDGAQAWLVGQAVALREMTWKASRSSTTRRFQDRWAALQWLLKPLAALDNTLPSLDGMQANPKTAAKHIDLLDRFARIAGKLEWTEDLTRQCLTIYGNKTSDFAASDVTASRQAYRAERLVLALDRLLAALDKPTADKLDPEIKQLFKLAQSIPDFDPTSFGRTLKSLADNL